MTRTTFFRLSIATILGGAALFWGGQLPLDGQSSLVSSAEARIGRPLTPMSYAGVARRTTRRAVAVGAAGAVAAGAVLCSPGWLRPHVRKSLMSTAGSSRSAGKKQRDKCRGAPVRRGFATIAWPNMEKFGFPNRRQE